MGAVTTKRPCAKLGRPGILGGFTPATWAKELHTRGEHHVAATLVVREICGRATDCGRLCKRLVKAPGLGQVHCVDIATGEKTELYPALEDPDFHCPEGRF